MLHSHDWEWRLLERCYRIAGWAGCFGWTGRCFCFRDRARLALGLLADPLSQRFLIMLGLLDRLLKGNHARLDRQRFLDLGFQLVHPCPDLVHLHAQGSHMLGQLRW
jgi:hypothetical protein